MAVSQADRSIAITTPLGEDKLLLASMVYTEQLGRPFIIKAELLSETQDLDFLAIIGMGVTIRWLMPEENGEAKKRYFSGYVSAFVQLPFAEGFHRYEATIVPWLWFLTRTADCRIFHKDMKPTAPDDMKAPSVLKLAFKIHGYDDFEPSLSGEYRELDHCVQYRETDFNFVSRLMEQEGIYYFFKQVDEGGVIKHKLVLADSASAHSEYPGYETLRYLASEDGAGETKGNILAWSRTKQVLSGTYKVNDYDFKRPKTSLLGSSSEEREHANASFEIYDFPSNFSDEASGDHGGAYAKLRIQELQAQHDIVTGRTNSPGLACGSKFTLEGHPRDDQNGAYLVVGLTYRCSAQNYHQANASSDRGVFECEFAAIPADSVFRPARITKKPKIHGPQTAIVVGPKDEEIYTDKFGRVKVQFHWDLYSEANQDTPCWVRVSQLWAGKKWGTTFLPRIGQEVIVEFLDGNPDRPIVTGAVYNGDCEPPYTLPEKAAVSTIKSNSTPKSTGFNELRFDDKKDEEQVFLHAEKDLEIRVKKDAKEWIGKDQHLWIKENQYELVEKDKHGHVKGDQLIKVEGNLGANVQKDQHVKVGGKSHTAVTGDMIAKVGGNLHENITGNLHAKSGGDVALQAAMNVHLKGGTVVVIEAGTQLSLKAGSSFIDIGPSGISIQGTMVNINSGGAAGSGSGAQPSDPADPDPAKDPLEAATAEGGSASEAKSKPEAPTPKQFSPSAIAMQEAAETGSAGVEG